MGKRPLVRLLRLMVSARNSSGNITLVTTCCASTRAAVSAMARAIPSKPDSTVGAKFVARHVRLNVRSWDDSMLCGARFAASHESAPIGLTDISL